MNTEQALDVYRQLIEQSMANGMFKSLSQLDLARQSLQALSEAVSKKENT